MLALDLCASEIALLLGRCLRDEVQHVLDDLLGCGDVPHGERAFAAVADGGREHCIALDGERDGLELLCGGVFGEEGDGQWRVQHGFGVITLEEQERAEHILIGLSEDVIF